MQTQWTWVAVGGGGLALGHRPKVKDLSRLASEGATHVLTLLSEREGALDVGDVAEAAGLVWFWLPLESANPAFADEAGAREAVARLKKALKCGGRVFIHCSAGIHRTGMIATALLRSLGLDREEAAEILRELRVLTADGVGESRLAWAARFASR